jgi:hypothetical protein
MAKKDKLLKFGHRWWEGVEATLTRPVLQHLLGLLVLNKKEVRVKLNECVIIKS